MTEQEFNALEVGGRVKRLCDCEIYSVTAVNVVNDCWWGKFREVVVAEVKCPYHRRYIYSLTVFYNLDNFELIREPVNPMSRHPLVVHKRMRDDGVTITPYDTPERRLVGRKVVNVEYYKIDWSTNFAANQRMRSTK